VNAINSISVKSWSINTY